MSGQQVRQSLLHKEFDHVYMIAFLIAIYIYFSSLNQALLFIPVALFLTRFFVNYQNKKSINPSGPEENLLGLGRKQEMLNLLTKRIYVNQDFFASLIASLMIFTVYYDSLDLTLIYLPICVILIRFFAHPENKMLNSALYGSVGAVLLLSIPVYFAVIFSDEPNEYPGVVMVVGASVGLAVLFAILLWLSGLVSIIKLLSSESFFRKNKAAYISYVFICVPPGFVLVSLLIN